MLKIALIGLTLILLLFLALPVEVNEVQAEIPPMDSTIIEDYELATFGLG